MANSFDVKLHLENSYYRFHITNGNYKGRIRRRLANKEYDELKNIAFNLRYELSKHFTNGDYNKNDVEAFIDSFISMNVKYDASILDYSSEFLESKSKKINKNTRNELTKSTLSAYKSAIKYFGEYLKKNNISSHPSKITDVVLNGFYAHIKGSHNYKVKLHTRIKGFIKYTAEIKGISVNPSYRMSVFTEEYDNQCPKSNDIALDVEDVQKLIQLREDFKSGKVLMEPNIQANQIPIELQLRYFNMKKENLVKSLDCFLLMISTGMYYADVMKSHLVYFTQGNSTHANYRRAKNGSLCRAIPIKQDGIFIGKEIINQYKIKSGTNFPLNLSLNHFAKHLESISTMADIGFKITNKMARKTFASHLYFNRELPIHFLQILLGHKDVKDTSHYLRISDNDIASEIVRRMSKGN